ncbi:MAG: 30S ribosomal protein S4e [Candidatus Ranarchaeia archaeon]|jgi:small subunit ribosomal protein S4e
MGSKGGKRHQKRIAAPRLWTIKRKSGKFTVKTRPGPHPTNKSVPLQIILRDVLKQAKTAKEVKHILNEGSVLVDGVVRKEKRFPVGLMDVLEIPLIKGVYRMVPDESHQLWLHSISSKDAKYKLCRIQNKRSIKGGNLQINLHDGRNILIPISSEDVFKPRDILKISIPSQKILSIIKFEEGVDAIVIDGRNVGKSGKIIAINLRYGAHTSTVTLESDDGTKFDTDIDYVFPIGEGRPLKDFTKKPAPVAKPEKAKASTSEPDTEDAVVVDVKEETPGGSNE